ncbi:hypothetical protein [Methylobacter sp. YRD-M1]|uniref:hypothetical protein n=1 Tax=Methylobacter sp. YRD-M1 TaxID=2911520 RepID=UPI00227CE0D5|nr:hypothetical protein [Methylobacter sp. YRD-M1]WAK02639.1 hypothetical protein LZ558_02280 [Methylobacter sp. YRD-M1]
MSASKHPFSGESVGVLLITLAGPLIWGVHFGIVYAAHHLICLLTGNSAAFWAQLAVIAATIAALLALLLSIFKPEIMQHMVRYESAQNISRSFLTGVMRLMALLSVFGVLWAGSAALFLPACTSIV